ncbi:MAG: RNA polymerase sigma factor [Chloroflexi bacterium]|nr:MAG: RNA polymerase sigma factor [Chloroflexota bacterium]
MHAEATLDASLMSGVSSSQALAAAQLVRQATGGDLDAFEELLRRLQRRVYGFAYQHLRDVDEAHDLAQEIFVKLYRNLGRYDPERPFEPWFWKLAANTTSTTGASGCRSRQSCQTKPSTKPRPPGRTIPCSSRRSRSSTPLTACRSSFTTTPTSPSSRSATASTCPSPRSSRAFTAREPSSATRWPRRRRGRDDRRPTPRVRARANPPRGIRRWLPGRGRSDARVGGAAPPRRLRRLPPPTRTGDLHSIPTPRPELPTAPGVADPRRHALDHAVSRPRPTGLDSSPPSPRASSETFSGWRAGAQAQDLCRLFPASMWCCSWR